MSSKNLPSILKVGFLSILLLGFSQFTKAQTATFYTGPGTFSGNVGIGGLAYHASEHIYLESEIGASNFITMPTAINRVGFILDVSGLGTFPTAVPNFEIYMKNVPTATTIFATGAYDVTGYTQVFNGTLNLTATATWLNVDLTTPFVRTAGSNLQVLLIKNNGTVQSGFNFNTANGNAVAGTGALTSRRYNSATLPVSGTTSLTASAFRSAIQLSHTTATDVSPTSFTLPSSSCFSTLQNIAVTITNTGTSSIIGAGGVNVNLTVSGANTATLNQVSGAAIPVGGTQVITFTNVNLNTAGVNNLRALVTLTGDQNSSNDTLRAALSTISTITTFPAVESAEPINVFPLAATVTGSRQLWRTNGSTPRYINADLTDSLGAQNGSVFYLFDAYGGTSSVGFTSRLFSNCLSLPAGQPAGNYKMNFWMSHDNSFATDLDSMYASVSTDKGLTWTRLAGFQRHNATFATPGWAMETVSLSAYAGQTIQLGFEGVSKYGNVIGLDNITVTANFPLPISLISFTGVKEGARNILNWSTANETNNKGFELQRSINGEKFSSIATVNSKAENGNSSSTLSYTYSDEQSFAGNNYYRLRQIDFNGKESFSNVVLLKGKSAKNLEISSLFPNPTTNVLNAIVSSDKEEKVTLSITDLAGKVINQQIIKLNQGSNNVQFNIQALTRGSYLIRLNSTNSNETMVQKFVKQ